MATVKIFLPNKKPKIVENVNFEIIEKKIQKLGGYVELISPEKLKIPKQILCSSNNITIDNAYKIINYVVQKYFPELNHIPIKFNNRLKTALGLAIDMYNLRNQRSIELNPSLLNKYSKYLPQVVFHEMAHMKFPGGHNIYEFRQLEYNNPYRFIKSRKLTSIS